MGDCNVEQCIMQQCTVLYITIQYYTFILHVTMQYCTLSIILNFVQAKRICKKNHSKEIFTVRVIPTIPINQLNMKFIILNKKKLVEIEKLPNDQILNSIFHI